jgi:hypothetical protein
LKIIERYTKRTAKRNADLVGQPREVELTPVEAWAYRRMEELLSAGHFYEDAITITLTEIKAQQAWPPHTTFWEYVAGARIDKWDGSTPHFASAADAR